MRHLLWVLDRQSSSQVAGQSQRWIFEVLNGGSHQSVGTENELNQETISEAFIQSPIGYKTQSVIAQSSRVSRKLSGLFQERKSLLKLSPFIFGLLHLQLWNRLFYPLNFLKSSILPFGRFSTAVLLQWVWYRVRIFFFFNLFSVNFWKIIVNHRKNIK